MKLKNKENKKALYYIKNNTLSKEIKLTTKARLKNYKKSFDNERLFYKPQGGRFHEKTRRKHRIKAYKLFK